jgi:hypothetical protein
MALVPIDINLLQWNLSSPPSEGLLPEAEAEVYIYLRDTSTQAVIYNKDGTVWGSQPLEPNQYGEVAWVGSISLV